MQGIKQILSQRLAAGLLLAGLMLIASSPSALADQVTATLDGLRDPGYTLIAVDPAGDLASPGPADWSGVAWTDLTAMYAAADSSNLYIYIDSPNYNNVDSTGQIGLLIDVDGQPGSGGSTDPWGNSITFAYTSVNGFSNGDTFLPDYAVRGNVSRDNGWTELRTWNGNWDTGAGVNWGGISGGEIGTHVAYSFGSGIEFAIPLSDIGDPDPAQVRLQFFGTQGGSTKGAYDTVPSDDQSTGWDDSTTQANLMTVPLAVDPAGDLASPGPADWDGVAWTDATAMQAWDDEVNLYLYLPMPAYNPAVSSGQIGLAIDTQTGGGTYDPWGNAITFNYAFKYQNLGRSPVADSGLPDYLIRGNIFSGADNGWTELRAWDGSNFDTGGGIDWGGIGNSGQGSLPGSKVAWTSGDGLRLTIPFSDIGVAQGDSVSLQFFGTQGGGGKGAYDTVPTDDQSNSWNDPTTQLYLATYDIPGTPPVAEGCQSGAAIDDNVFWNELGHDSRDTLYRTPGGPVTTGTAVTLRFRSACDDLTEAQVRLWDDYLNAETYITMTKVASDSQYDWWEADVPVSAVPTIYWYRFVAIDGSSVAYYDDDSARDGGWGQAFNPSPDNSWQLTVYDPAFHTPDFVKNGVMYQIFPDRFRDGDPANDPQPGRYFYGELNGTIYRSDPNGGTGNPWNTVICDPRDAADCPGTYSLNFYGGDLQGVIDQLDYLDNLGITVLYFNPIFESPSNHKYDTTDYGVISRDFGDLATFNTLVTEANSRGMSIILDGVFNHTSSDSVYFDRYSRYDAAGNLTSPNGPGTNDGSGACESEASPYRDWYYFADVPAGTGPCVGSDGTPGGATYESWFGFDSLPKLQAGSPEVRDLIFSGGPQSVALYWLAEGADGWRFDVGGDVDPGRTNDPGNDYWESFRSTVRALNPDAYMVLEEWGNASPWLLGGEMDATMNYQYSSAMLSFWRDTTFTDNDHNSGSSAGPLAPLTPSQLDARLQNWIERYPPEALYAMMNLLDSHDTNRALFMLDENAASGTDPTPLLDPAYDWSDAITRLKGVALLQFTLPGAPTIYYGDEVGLVGPTYYYNGKWEDDPYNRQPYPWLDETGTPFYTHLQAGGAGHTDLLPYYQALSTARSSHPALRTGSFDTLLTDDDANVYAYGRLLSDYSDAAVVVANRAAAAQDVTLDVAGYLPVGASFTDVLGGGSYAVDGAGVLTLPAVPGMSGALLVADAPLAAPPAALSDLAVTGIHPDALDLSWSAAPGADSYDLYRSPISGGGYSWIATTSGTSYTDTGLDVANDYYYVVVGVNGTTLLESAASNEAGATTAYQIGWANLQWPPTLTHTISAINPTDNVYGQVWIDGYTGLPGATPGLLAEVGYGPVGTAPGAGWVWEPMVFNVDAGNNDEFAGTLLPDMLGTFCYTTRFSGDGGNTWFYAVNGPDEGNPTCPGPYGVLDVLPSADTTPPDAPTNLAVTGTTNSSISLAWDLHPNPDGDLFGFEIYRENIAAPGYTRIATLNDPTATAYNDLAVTTDETYNYYVVAFDDSFNRSEGSNIVQATAEPRMVAVTFHATVPAYTPGTIFIAGSIPEFGPWNPGFTALTQVGSDSWEYTLDILDGTTVEYKFTRGSWETVEKEADGNTEIPNRTLTVDYGASGTQVVNLTIANWRDPIVTAYGPADGSTGVSPYTTVPVTWNQAMPGTNSFDVSDAAGTVAGSFSYDPATWTVTFTPDSALALGEIYTVTVSGQVDVAGDVQQVSTVFSYTTMTAEEVLTDLISQIESLQDAGVLNGGQSNSLITKLEAALASFNNKNTKVVPNRLNAFVNEVESYIDDGVFSPWQGQVLIDWAQLVIDDFIDG